MGLSLNIPRNTPNSAEITIIHLIAISKNRGGLNMSSKKSLTSLDLAKLLSYLKIIEGCKVVNIYGIGENFFFKFLHPEGYLWLAFNPRVGLFITTKIPQFNRIPTSFIRSLRKNVRNSYVKSIYQVNLDRILTLTLEDGHKIIFESVREGNLILLGENDKIKLAFREKKMRDRIIKRGIKYVPPPIHGFDPLILNPEDIVLKPSNREYKSKNILSIFLKRINVPGEVIAEAIFRSGLNPLENIKKIWDRDDLENITYTIISNIKNLYLEALTENRCYITVKGSEIIGVYPFEPKHLGRFEEGKNFMEEVDRYFSKIIIENIKETLKELRGKPSRDKIKELIEEYREKAKSFRKKAQIIMENISFIDNIINEYRLLRDMKYRWEEIEEKMKKRRVLSIDHKKYRLLLELKDEIIEIDATLSAAKNAERIYERAKVLEEKLGRALRHLKQVGSLEESIKTPVEAITFRRAEKGRWYEQYRYFISSEGVLVVGGKNASQNEILVRKYLRPNDLFFHADIYGGPVVIVKIEDKNIGEKTLHEAAQFAACYSRAWEANLYSIDVYWVRGEQVSKKAPSGEYLAKGAFMIYGKRNYIRNISLDLAIGVRENFDIIAAPPSAIEKRCIAFVHIQPGNIQREFGAKKIASILSRLLNHKISANSIAKLLPKGGIYIVRYEKVGKDGNI